MDFYEILKRYITEDGIKKYARIVAEMDMEIHGMHVRLLEEDKNVQQYNL
jgi:hypothetical protein